MILAIIFPNLIKVGIIVDFLVNQEFIAKVLCINKEVVTSSCNGKCYLKAQLKEAEKQEEQKAPTSKKAPIEILQFYPVSSVDSEAYVFGVLNKLNVTIDSKVLTDSFLSHTFRPPKFYFI